MRKPSCCQHIALDKPERGQKLVQNIVIEALSIHLRECEQKLELELMQMQLQNIYDHKLEPVQTIVLVETSFRWMD